MEVCRKCGAQLNATSAYCGACGVSTDLLEIASNRQAVGEIFKHVPHPHIAKRKKEALMATSDVYTRANTMQRFNAFLAVKITGGVGTMWCAYLFAIIASISLPDAVRGGTPTLISWIAQTFLQLVLLSIIIVGQKVASEASDKRALDTYNDAEAVLHEAIQIQAHLAAQDKLLSALMNQLTQQTTSQNTKGLA